MHKYTPIPFGRKLNAAKQNEKLVNNLEKYVVGLQYLYLLAYGHTEGNISYCEYPRNHQENIGSKQAAHKLRGKKIYLLGYTYIKYRYISILQFWEWR